MIKLQINGYQVTIYETDCGDKLFIHNPQGNEIYAHRVMKGEAVERAISVISKQ